MSIANCRACSSRICSTGTATFSSANHDIEGADEATSGRAPVHHKVISFDYVWKFSQQKEEPFACAH